MNERTGLRWQVGRWSRNSLVIAMVSVLIVVIPLLRDKPSSAEVNAALAMVIAAITTISLTTLRFQAQSLDSIICKTIAIGSTAIVPWLVLFFVAPNTLFAILGASGIMFILAFYAHAAITKMIHG